jgi:hypothetical protein
MLRPAACRFMRSRGHILGGVGRITEPAIHDEMRGRTRLIIAKSDLAISMGLPALKASTTSARVGN